MHQPPIPTRTPPSTSSRSKPARERRCGAVAISDVTFPAAGRADIWSSFVMACCSLFPSIPIDWKSKGVPSPFLEDVAADPGKAAGHFDFSRTGIFVYLSGIGMRPSKGTASNPSGKWQVSTGGGGAPLWSRQGQELFFTTTDQIMVTQYAAQ